MPVNSSLLRPLVRSARTPSQLSSRTIMTSSRASAPKVVLTRALPTSVLGEAAKRGDIELVKWNHAEKAADRKWLLDNAKGASGIVVMLADKVCPGRSNVGREASVVVRGCVADLSSSCAGRP